MLRAVVLMAAVGLFALGCGSGAGGGTGADGPLPRLHPCSLEGDRPFGKTLHGVGAFGDPSGAARAAQSIAVDVDVYFPRGVAPGAPILVAHPNGYPHGGLIVGAETLDASRHAHAIALRGYQPHGGSLALDGTLDDDGLHAEVTLDFSDTDLSALRTAHVDFCPTTDAPAPRLSIVNTVTAPELGLVLAPTVPIDESTLATLAVIAGGASLGTTSSWWNGVIVADAAVPPNVGVTLDTSGLRDVLGRSYASTGGLSPLATTAALTDLTFETEPPKGAIASTQLDAVKFTAGHLTLRRSVVAGYLALISLGDLSPARSFTLHGTRTCQDHQLFAAAVDADGRRVPIALDCAVGAASRAIDAKVTLPGGGATWLVIADLTEMPPRSYPDGPRDTLDLQSITVD